MATVNTSALRVNSANKFATTVVGSYAFIGKPTEWSETSDTPPTPANNVDAYNDLHNQMLSLKRVVSDDVHNMIRRINWTSGLVYDIYRHDYSTSLTSYSGATRLYDANYIVISQNNGVYACLGNNGNQVSTVEPQNTNDTPFYTSDGYQWVRLFTIDANILANKSTSLYIPVSTDDLIVYNSGELASAVIDSAGTGYTARPSGSINALPYYFCKITGDGSGAVARVTVFNGSITEINIVRGGQDYTFANIDFSANKVYATLTDLDREVNSLDPEGNGDFRSTVIIPPSGGWGTNIIKEVGATTVGIFTEFSFDESDFIDNVEYRQVGLIRDIVTSQTNPSHASAYQGIKVSDLGGIVNYQTGEIITQQVELGDEDNTLVNARGIVVGWDATNGIVFYIQDPKYCLHTDGNMYEFGGAGTIIGETSTKITTPDETYTASQSGLTFTNGYAPREVTKYTGDVIYISNKPPIQRTSTQTEKLSFILSF